MQDETLGTAQVSLERFAANALPRILTQVDRDPASPTYGCADRNWWHYKIRDFPSVILQQSGEALWNASRLEPEPERASALVHLAQGSARFWSHRATRFGAFEEYYPFERGYPPLAFSTLSVAKLVAAGVVPIDDVRAGFVVAAKQLRHRFESEALNQQAAGLAALGWLRRLTPDLVPSVDLERVTRRTLALQHDEGWFPEYGGPDTGYLSVTVDCLWDAYDATGDDRFVDAAENAVGFLADVVVHHGGSPGMVNSRNTDYLVPYGLVRMALEDRSSASRAASLVATVFGDAGASGHPLAAVDDRYLCHYIGASAFRALVLLKAAGPARVGGAILVQDFAERSWWAGAGYWHHHAASIRLAVALRKGGVFSGTLNGRAVADFGWRVSNGTRSGSDVVVSHWWTDRWAVVLDGDQATVEGTLVGVKPAHATPARHMVLRVLAAVLGQRIITTLKNRLIFRSPKGGVHYRRTIRLTAEGIEVSDVFEGLAEGAQVSRAPRASMRHVASADSAHPEDLVLCAAARDERIERRGARCEIVTTYT